MDPTGATITCSDKDKGDCASIATNINWISRTQYKFNNKGRLVVDRSARTNRAGSRYYSSRLDKAIAARGTIDITKDTKTASGQDISEAGEANTNIPGTPGTVRVTVSGKAGPQTLGTNKEPISSGPEYVQMHELVGHAIPRIVGSDTGNAIDNENKVRQEVAPGKLRESDPNHIEYFPFETWEEP